MADEIELMEAALDRVVAVINNPEVVWQCRAATELNASGRCKDAVQYTVDHEGCNIMVLSGTDLRENVVFRDGAVTMIIDNSPVVMRLPPELAEQTVKAAIKGVMRRNGNN